MQSCNGAIAIAGCCWRLQGSKDSGSQSAKRCWPVARWCARTFPPSEKLVKTCVITLPGVRGSYRNMRIPFEPSLNLLVRAQYRFRISHWVPSETCTFACTKHWPVREYRNSGMLRQPEPETTESCMRQRIQAATAECKRIVISETQLHSLENIRGRIKE